MSLLGLPNAGKSTLLNALVGAKVAIVSSKPQTTRSAIQGVLTLEGAQVIFIDTPGIHQGKLAIHGRMMQEVRESLAERDLLVWVADASRGIQPEEADALRVIQHAPAPKILALNKVDLVSGKPQLLPLLEHYHKLELFDEFIPISAQTGEGLDRLRKAILARLPEGPPYFPADHFTDQPERHLAAELIREKALELARQEVPHAVAVLVDSWEESGRLVRIAATVYVERDGQKRIVIGAKGEMLKRIGTGARLEMERLFGKKIFLELFVKVRKDWRESADFLNELDWRKSLGGAAS